MAFGNHRTFRFVRQFCVQVQGRARLLTLLGVLLCLLSGGQTGVQAQRAGGDPAAALPPLGAPQAFAPHTNLYTVRLPHNNGFTKLLIFMRAAQAATPLPCIFIAPAGTPLLYGNALGEFGAPREYMPYVNVGYCVVAYEIDGDVPDALQQNSLAIRQASYAFRQAYMGVTNAQQAITYALARIPNIDPKRLYTAGHSSAGTLSLQAAAADKRVAACIAYAPCCDLDSRIGPEILSVFARHQPGFDVFIHNMAPINNTKLIQCPTFVFHADDDSNVPLADNAAFVTRLRQTNTQVTFARVPTGNHYQSMITQGIPQAIAWLGKQTAPDAPAKQPTTTIP